MTGVQTCALPICFPVTIGIVKIELVRKGEVRRAKLYYLRELRGKAAKIRERRGADDLEVTYAATTAAEAAVAAPVVEEAVAEQVVEQVVETPAAPEVAAETTTDEAKS